MQRNLVLECFDFKYLCQRYAKGWEEGKTRMRVQVGLG